MVKKGNFQPDKFQPLEGTHLYNFSNVIRRWISRTLCYRRSPSLLTSRLYLKPALNTSHAGTVTTSTLFGICCFTFTVTTQHRFTVLPLHHNTIYQTTVLPCFTTSDRLSLENSHSFKYKTDSVVVLIVTQEVRLQCECPCIICPLRYYLKIDYEGIELEAPLKVGGVLCYDVGYTPPDSEEYKPPLPM